MQMPSTWKDNKSPDYTPLSQSIDSITPEPSPSSISFVEAESKQSNNSNDSGNKRVNEKKSILKKKSDEPIQSTEEKQIDELTSSNEASLCPCFFTNHLNLVALDKVYDLKIDELFDLIFGDDSPFLNNFLASLNSNVKIEPWSEGERKIHYVKPLTNPLGPKSTRCIVTEKKGDREISKYATVEGSVESLDVPSGSSFRAKLRYCMMNDGFGATRLLVTSECEWLKSSWLKAAIEKGTVEGNLSYFKSFDQALRNYIDSPKDGSVNNIGVFDGDNEKSNEIQSINELNVTFLQNPIAFLNSLIPSPVFNVFEIIKQFIIQLPPLPSMIILSLLLVSLNLIIWNKIHHIQIQIETIELLEVNQQHKMGPELFKSIQLIASVAKDLKLSLAQLKSQLRHPLAARKIGNLLG